MELPAHPHSILKHYYTSIPSHFLKCPTQSCLFTLLAVLIMHFFTAVFAAIALAAPIFASPASAPLRNVERFAGKTSGKYIVKLKDGVSKTAVISKLKASSKVTHGDWKLLNGFAGTLYVP